MSLNKLALPLVIALICGPAIASAAQFTPNVDFRSKELPGIAWPPPPSPPVRHDTYSILQVGFGFARMYDTIWTYSSSFISGPPTQSLGFMYASDASNPDDVTLTTFYGVDIDTNLSDAGALMTGFDALDPEYVFFDETYHGLTEDFPADFLGTFAIGDLGTNALFHDFDFTRFVGDPDSIVYAFQATLPLSELHPIPEPSSVFLAVVGFSLAAIAVRRRRQSAHI